MRSDILKQSFAARLREVMEEKGLTQMQLATSIGVAQSRVSEWRAGKAMPQRRVAELLADQLLVNLEWLMAGTGPKGIVEKSSFQIKTAAKIADLLKDRGYDPKTVQAVFDSSERVLRDEPPGYGSDWMKRAIDAEERALAAESKLADLKKTLAGLAEKL